MHESALAAVAMWDASAVANLGTVPVQTDESARPALGCELGHGTCLPGARCEAAPARKPPHLPTLLPPPRQHVFTSSIRKRSISTCRWAARESSRA
jgi:hypothetical protein